MGIIILFIVAVVVSSLIINGLENLFMKLLNLSGMFVNTKKKMLVIIVLALFLEAIIIKVFGITIPR